MLSREQYSKSGYLEESIFLIRLKLVRIRILPLNYMVFQRMVFSSEFGNFVKKTVEKSEMYPDEYKWALPNMTVKRTAKVWLFSELYA
jgi:hypothetical protein